MRTSEYKLNTVKSCPLLVLKHDIRVQLQREDSIGARDRCKAEHFKRPTAQAKLNLMHSGFICCPLATTYATYVRSESQISPLEATRPYASDLVSYAPPDRPCMPAQLLRVISGAHLRLDQSLQCPIKHVHRTILQHRQPIFEDHPSRGGNGRPLHLGRQQKWM